MLLGEYTHTLDPKKRLALPAKLRQALGRSVVITRGLDTCLFVYAAKEWQKIAQKLGALPMASAASRDFGRFLLAGAVETQVDSLGRILIPEFLKDFAGLTGTVIIAGLHNRLELWDHAAWRDRRTRIEKDADALAEKLGVIGAF